MKKTTANLELERNLDGLGLKYTFNEERNTYVLKILLNGEIKVVYISIKITNSGARCSASLVDRSYENEDEFSDKYMTVEPHKGWDIKLEWRVALYVSHVKLRARRNKGIHCSLNLSDENGVECHVSGHLDVTSPSQINLYLTTCCEFMAKWMPGYIAVVKGGVDPKIAFECCRDGKPLPVTGKPVSMTEGGSGETSSGNPSVTGSCKADAYGDSESGGHETGAYGDSGNGSRRTDLTEASGSAGQGSSSGASSGNGGQSGRSALPSGSAGPGRSVGTVSSAGGGRSSRETSSIDLGIVMREYPQCLENRQRLLGLLMDLYVDQTKQINLAMYVYDNKLVDEIRETPPGDSLRFGRWVRMLEDEYGISEENAHMALEMWIRALHPEG